MTKQRKARIQKLISIIAIAMLFVIALFAFSYHVHEKDHVCNGQDCPICASLRQCEQVQSQIETIYWISTLFVVFVLCCFLRQFFCLLPVLWQFIPLRKIRLNN
jgi:hypothetical protein